MPKEFVMVNVYRDGESMILADCYVYTHVEQFGEDADGRRGWPVLKVDDVVIVSSYYDDTITSVVLTEDEKTYVTEFAANKALGR